MFRGFPSTVAVGAVACAASPVNIAAACAIGTDVSVMTAANRFVARISVGLRVREGQKGVNSGPLFRSNCILVRNCPQGFLSAEVTIPIDVGASAGGLLPLLEIIDDHSSGY